MDRLVGFDGPPHGFANPGGFDYERWLFQQGIEATGYVRDGGENLRLDTGSGIYVIDRWRQGLHERIREILPDCRMLPGKPWCGLWSWGTVPG